MANLDKEARKRMNELEAQLQDAHIVIDLQREELMEAKAEVRALKGQLALLRQDRRYELA